MNFITIEAALIPSYQKKDHEQYIEVNFDLVSKIVQDKYGKAIIFIDGKAIETRENYSNLIRKLRK